MAKKRKAGYNPTPVTRHEKFWAAIAGLFTAPDPITRIEFWMKKTSDRIKAIEDGGGGGGEVPDIVSGNWVYKLYSDGYFEAWYSAENQTFTIEETSGVLYRSGLRELALPSDLISGKTVTVRYCNVNVYHHNYVVFGAMAGHTATGFEFYAISGGSRTSNSHYTIDGYIEGRVE